MAERKKKTCSGCGGERDRPGQAFCRKCHRGYMQTWRQGRVSVSREELEYLRSLKGKVA